MIDELVVSNLGLIDRARLEPAPGLTVVSGETGTGKTLLLGALRLLLGGEARSQLVGPHADEAVVEGRFFRPDGTEVGASRRLPRDGRSRAYLDGSISSARALDEAVAGLVDIVGQHDQLSLTRADEVRSLVDGALDVEGREAAARYRSAWEVLGRVERDRRTLGDDLSTLMRELDLVTHQTGEISAAALQPGEDEELQGRSDRLRNAEEIGHLLGSTLDGLQAAREAVGESVAAIRKVAALDPDAASLAAALEGEAEGLAALVMDVRSAAEGVAADPVALDEVETRLTAIGELRRKYGRTVDDILRFGEMAARRRGELESLLERAKVIDQEVDAARRALEDAALSLTRAREQAGEQLASGARRHLVDLGFSDPVLAFRLSSVEPASVGADRVDLEFASDGRLAPGPVGRVASGGELSRLVLALRVAGGGNDGATLVFDEVDAGVGGATALTLGRKLADLARERQVLCVTHLPQVAAFADRHYVITRSDAVASVDEVEGTARVAELSRMLAGLPESERGREAAEELLEAAGAR